MIDSYSLQNLDQSRFSNILELTKSHYTDNLISFVDAIPPGVTGGQIATDILNMEKYLKNMPNTFSSFNDAIATLHTDIDKIITTDIPDLYSKFGSLSNLYNTISNDIGDIQAILTKDWDCIKTLLHVPFLTNFTSPLTVLESFVTDIDTYVSNLYTDVSGIESKIATDITNIESTIKSDLDTYFADVKTYYSNIQTRYNTIFKLPYPLIGSGDSHFSAGSSGYSWHISSLGAAIYITETVLSQTIVHNNRGAYVAWWDISTGAHGESGNVNKYNGTDSQGVYDYFYLGAIPSGQPDFSNSYVGYKEWIISTCLHLVSQAIEMVASNMINTAEADLKKIYEAILGLPSELSAEMGKAMGIAKNYSGYLSTEINKFSGGIGSSSSTTHTSINSAITDISNSLKNTCIYKSTVSGTSTPPPTYSVSFVESGLPVTSNRNNTWTATVYNSSNKKVGTSTAIGTTNTINNLPAGSYTAYFTVSQGYYGYGTNKISFNITNTNQSIKVPFKQASGQINITSSGIPSNTLWSVSINGTVYKSNSSNTIVMTGIPAGSYKAIVYPPSGYQTSVNPITVTSTSGKISTFNVAFTKIPTTTKKYTSTIYQSGLSYGTAWLVQVLQNGNVIQTHNTTVGTPVTLSLPAGTYELRGGAYGYTAPVDYQFNPANNPTYTLNFTPNKTAKTSKSTTGTTTTTHTGSTIGRRTGGFRQDSNESSIKKELLNKKNILKDAQTAVISSSVSGGTDDLVADGLDTAALSQDND